VKLHLIIALGCCLLSCERADAQAPTSAPRLVGPSARAPERASAPIAATAAASSQPEAVSAPAPSQALVLAAGGDVNFGRECGQAILKDAGYDPFAKLGPAWSGADARFANLESQLSDQNGVTQNPHHRLIFTGPPGGADVLARARLSLISTANNHAWDYGKSALFETIDNLRRVGVPFAGTGRSADEAYRPAVIQVNGLSVALFAVTHIWNQGPFGQHEGQNYVAWADATRLKAGIERARREQDFVLVSYHGGEEYVDAPVDRTRRFVKAIMALGVDAIIGHHPHVPQGIGWVEGRPIVYSLGNFVFAGHDDRPWTKQSFFVRLTLRKGEPAQLSACPFALDGHVPRSLSLPSEALGVARFRQHLIDISTSVGGSSVGTPDELGCVPVAPKR
jgi:poly-gamma-glutamate synthesis protein (capsule biosynthesis protein)